MGVYCALSGGSTMNLLLRSLILSNHSRNRKRKLTTPTIWPKLVPIHQLVLTKYFDISNTTQEKKTYITRKRLRKGKVSNSRRQYWDFKPVRFMLVDIIRTLCFTNFFCHIVRMVVINGLAPPRVASIQWQSIEVVIDWLGYRMLGFSD